ncbi:MAG: hypothetical protein IIU83_05375 [Fibrobacteraceae bacterium]|nr:hypothetical protein [Fibrobacteraceae bacterium]
MSEGKELVEIGKKAAPVIVCVATGAAIGSMFAPGLGTAIGSGIGAIIWGTATIIKAAKENRKKRIKQMFLSFMGCRVLK